MEELRYLEVRLDRDEIIENLDSIGDVDVSVIHQENQPIDFQVKQTFAKVADQLSQDHLLQCLQYLTEKITQNQGVKDAMILREKQLSALHLKLCIRTIKKEKRACLYRQSNYKKIQEVDSQVITIDQQIKDDTNALLEMNKRIMADSLKLERESGLQIKKLISGYTLAMADKTKNVHETLKQNVSLKKFLSSDH